MQQVVAQSPWRHNTTLTRGRHGQSRSAVLGRNRASISSGSTDEQTFDMAPPVDPPRLPTAPPHELTTSNRLLLLMASKDRHPDKDIRKAIKDAERAGWTADRSKGAGHRWGSTVVRLRLRSRDLRVHRDGRATSQSASVRPSRNAITTQAHQTP